MFNSIGFFVPSEACDDDFINLAITRRTLRDKHNPLDLDNAQFQKKFRLNKGAFLYVLENINLKEGKRANYIPPVIRLAATLQVLASGSYQYTLGNDFIAAIGQSTLSVILDEVSRLLEQKLCNMWIKSENENETKMWFYQKYRFPGVVGVVDGTHVYILRPKTNEEVYVNRKGKHSLNVMVICDHNHRITNISPRFPGSSHDAFVWNQSAARQVLEDKHANGNGNSWLLGDSGYPLEPWLITPYRSADPHSAESTFNDVHAKARSNIERCIGEYKGRWRILMEERKARYSPEKAARFANICAALHNICIAFKVSFNPHHVAPADDPILATESSTNPNREARTIRDRIMGVILS